MEKKKKNVTLSPVRKALDVGAEAVSALVVSPLVVVQAVV